jgi:uncharacterized protein
MQSLKIAYLLVLSISILSCQSGTKKNEKEANTLTEKEVMTTDDNQPFISQLTIHEAAFSGDIETVRSLVMTGAPVNEINADGYTPLMLAAFNGHADVVLHLLKTGADVNVADRQLLTPLHFAASGPNPDAVEVLLEYGSTINAADGIEHFTPLMYAAAEGNIDVVKILLKYGADTSLTDDDGDTAEAFAKQNNHDEIAKLIQNAK